MNDSHKSLWFNSIPDFNSSCGHDDRQLEQTLVYQLCSFVGFFLFVCLVFFVVFFVDFLSTSLSSSVECFGGQYSM